MKNTQLGVLQSACSVSVCREVRYDKVLNNPLRHGWSKIVKNISAVIALYLASVAGASADLIALNGCVDGGACVGNSAEATALSAGANVSNMATGDYYLYSRDIFVLGGVEFDVVARINEVNSLSEVNTDNNDGGSLDQAAFYLTGSTGFVDVTMYLVAKGSATESDPLAGQLSFNIDSIAFRDIDSQDGVDFTEVVGYYTSLTPQYDANTYLENIGGQGPTTGVSYSRVRMDAEGDGSSWDSEGNTTGSDVRSIATYDTSTSGAFDEIRFVYALTGDDTTNNRGMSPLIDLTGITVVPVPAAVWLFASGLLGLVGIARRRKTA